MQIDQATIPGPFSVTDPSEQMNGRAPLWLSLLYLDIHTLSALRYPYRTCAIVYAVRCARVTCGTLWSMVGPGERNGTERNIVGEGGAELLVKYEKVVTPPDRQVLRPQKQEAVHAHHSCSLSLFSLFQGAPRLGGGLPRAPRAACRCPARVATPRRHARSPAACCCCLLL